MHTCICSMFVVHRDFPCENIHVHVGMCKVQRGNHPLGMNFIMTMKNPLKFGNIHE